MAIPGFRILSRDYSTVPTGVPNMQPEIAVPGAAVAAQSAQFTAQTSARIAQSAQRNTEQAAASYESLARANEYAGASAPSTSKIGSSLAQLGTGIAEAFLRIKEQQNKQKLEQAKIEFYQEAQNLASDAASITRGEGGVFRYRNQANALVNKYQELGLPAEDIAPGLVLLFDQHRKEQERIDKATLEEAVQLTEQTRAADVARIMSPYITDIASLSAGASAQGIEDTRQAILGRLSNDLSSVDAMTGVMVTETLLNQLNSELYKNNVRVQSVAVDVQKLSEAQQIDAQAYNEALSTGDWATYVATISRVKAALPPGAQQVFTSQLDVQERVLNRSIQQASYSNMLRSAAERPIPLNPTLDLTGLNNKQVGAIAYELANNPIALQQVLTTYQTYGNRIDLGGAELPPGMQAVVSLAQEFREFEQSTKPKIINDINEARIKLSSVQRTMTADWFEFELETRQAENADPELVALSQVFKDKLGIGNIPLVNITPEQRRQYQAEWQRFKQEELARRTQSINALQSQLTSQYQRYAQYGLYTQAEGGAWVPANLNPGEVYKEVNETLERVRRISQVSIQERGGLPPNFNMPQLHTQRTAEGKALVFPFAPLGTPIAFENNQMFGAPRNGGSRPHQGLDFGLEIGTPIISYVSGTVVAVGDRGGYGKSVEIEAPDGSNHFFAHLNSFNVRNGQQIKPGDVIAYSGNTGVGSGAHLHWEVTVNGQHVNPLDYAAKIPRQLQQVRAAQASGLPNGFIPAGNGQFVTSSSNAMQYANQGATAPSEYSSANPVRQQFASSNKADYAFDASKNYGYAALRDDRLRLRLHEVARNNNIPAQWLADVIQKESGWRADAVNPYTNATGLLQFMPDTLSDRATMGTIAATTQHLLELDAVEQLKYVDQYLRFIRRVAGEINTPDELVVGVFQGVGTLIEYKRRPHNILDYVDATNFSVRQYLLDLGRDAGRQYQTPATRVVTHTSYEPGCATCQQAAYGGFFVTHEGIA